ncbi:MAG: hypothetical protein ABI644_05730 [Arenimonas sp.]
MKRMRPLVLAISVGLVSCFAITSAMSAEESNKTEQPKAKKKSYKERMFDDAESYDLSGKDIKKEEQIVQLYPLATRIAPSQEGDGTMVKLRNQMVIAYQKNNDEEAKKLAQEIKANPKANANDRATAVKVLLLVATRKDSYNHKEAIPLLEESMEINGLDNNAYYGQMSELAQRYLLNQDYEDAYETSEKFLKETKVEKIEMLKVKGNALFRLNRFAESLVPLEKVHAADPADIQATQMLAKAYSDGGQPAKAAELTKTIVQATGNDRAAQVNLAITYLDAKQVVEASDVIAELRKNNQLVEERDYLAAMNVYTAMKNKEKDTVAVMEEGFNKGIIKPTAVRYNILADAYYYSDLPNNTKKAIEWWAKAAPIAKDGGVYLNMAIVECQEDMYQACKESAKSALSKGGIKPGEAWQEIANAEEGLGNSAAAAEARRKSGK